MDYQRAKQLRQTGLGQLIKGRMVAGEGIGAIKSSISDKFTAKMTGIKETFDPMNIMKKMFFGSKFLTAMGGRAMGRSARDIRYFSGYDVNDPRYKKKKDPTRTKIGPGRIMPLKVGDGEADVLAKMFNFMKVNFDKEQQQYELQQQFREEQQQEDERRHRELIDTIKKTRGRKKTIEKDGESPFSGIFASIGKFALWVIDAFKSLKKWSSGVVDKIKDILTSVKRIVDLARFVSNIKTLFGFFATMLNPLALQVAAIVGVIGILTEGMKSLMNKASLFDAEGNLTGVGEFIDKIQKFAGGKGILPDNVKTETQNIKEQEGNKDWKRMWETRIFDQGQTVSPQMSEQLKLSHGINVPKEQIEKPKDYTYKFGAHVMKGHGGRSGVPNGLTKDEQESWGTNKDAPVKTLKDFMGQKREVGAIVQPNEMKELSPLENVIKVTGKIISAAGSSIVNYDPIKAVNELYDFETGDILTPKLDVPALQIDPVPKMDVPRLTPRSELMPSGSDTPTIVNKTTNVSGGQNKFVDTQSLLARNTDTSINNPMRMNTAVV